MRIEIRTNIPQGQRQAQGTFLDSKTILRYLIGDDDQLETSIICKPADMNLFTTDKELYEAIGSIKPYDNFKLNKLAKFFEAVSVSPTQKPILTDKRVEELRELALKQNNNKKSQ